MSPWPCEKTHEIFLVKPHFKNLEDTREHELGKTVNKAADLEVEVIFSFSRCTWEAAVSIWNPSLLSSAYPVGVSYPEKSWLHNRVSLAGVKLFLGKMYHCSEVDSDKQTYGLLAYTEQVRLTKFPPSWMNTTQGIWTLIELWTIVHCLENKWIFFFCLVVEEVTFLWLKLQTLKKNLFLVVWYFQM